jgi:hypothetical protein
MRSDSVICPHDVAHNVTLLAGDRWQSDWARKCIFVAREPRFEALLRVAWAIALNGARSHDARWAALALSLASKFKVWAR